MTAAEKAALERQMRYLGEIEASLCEITRRIKGARHFVRRREKDHAIDEIIHLAAEAKKLETHLEAWAKHVIPRKESSA